MGVRRWSRCAAARPTGSHAYLFTLEEALLVTVGDVERERQDPGRVLHALNGVVQPRPAGTLNTDTGVNRHRRKRGGIIPQNLHLFGHSQTGAPAYPG